MLFFQSPPKGAGKMVPRQNCRKTFWRFLTIFDAFCPARKLSKKSVEKLFDTFWRFLTLFDVAPFRRPLLQSADFSPLSFRMNDAWWKSMYVPEGCGCWIGRSWHCFTTAVAFFFCFVLFYLGSSKPHRPKGPLNCTNIFKRRLLQRSEGNFSDRTSRWILQGIFWWKKKKNKEIHPKINSKFQIRIWELRGQNQHWPWQVLWLEFHMNRPALVLLNGLNKDKEVIAEYSPLIYDKGVGP